MKEIVLYNRYGFVFKVSNEYWPSEVLIEEKNIEDGIKVLFSLDDTVCKVIYDDIYSAEDIINKFKEFFSM